MALTTSIFSIFLTKHTFLDNFFVDALFPLLIHHYKHMLTSMLTGEVINYPNKPYSFWVEMSRAWDFSQISNNFLRSKNKEVLEASIIQTLELVFDWLRHDRYIWVIFITTYSVSEISENYEELSRVATNIKLIKLCRVIFMEDLSMKTI